VWMFIHNIQGAYDGAAHAANNHYAPINTTVGPSVGRCVWLTGSTSVKTIFPFTRQSMIKDLALSCKRCVTFVTSLTDLILDLLITFLITVKLVEWTPCFAQCFW